MTRLKKQFIKWQDGVMTPASTLFFRALITALSSLAVAGISVVIIFILDVRDTVKDNKIQRVELNALKRNDENVRQTINLMLLNDQNHGIPTTHVRNIFESQQLERP